MKKIFFLCCVLFMLNENYALAYTDGTTWGRLSKAGKVAYVLGVLDAWFHVDDFATSTATEGQTKQSLTEEYFHKAATCMLERKPDQLVGIVQKYFTENPKEWYKPMTVIIYDALADACAVK
jgi:hypothetical protein